MADAIYAATQHKPFIWWVHACVSLPMNSYSFYRPATEEHLRIRHACAKMISFR
jgi:hypothetical protein